MTSYLLGWLNAETIGAATLPLNGSLAIGKATRLGADGVMLQPG